MRYKVINRFEDIDALKGSKYIDANVNEVFPQIRELLEAGERVLFFGLPCKVAALYGYLKARPDNLLTCELVCHGPTYKTVHEQYLTYLEHKYNSRLSYFTVRYKKGEWKPPYLYAEFTNGKVFSRPLYNTEYGYAFSAMGLKRCYLCKFKGNDRTGDIMIGDFWGVRESDQSYNQRGVSVIFAETSKGLAFVKGTLGIKLFAITFEEAVKDNPMVIRSRSKKDILFEEHFSEEGLFKAVDKSMGFRRKIQWKLYGCIPRKTKHLITSACNTFRKNKRN